MANASWLTAIEPALELPNATLLTRCPFTFSESLLTNLYGDSQNIGVVDYVYHDKEYDAFSFLSCPFLCTLSFLILFLFLHSKGVCMVADVVSHHWKPPKLERKPALTATLDRFFHQTLKKMSALTWAYIQKDTKDEYRKLSEQFEKQLATSSTYSSVLLLEYTPKGIPFFRYSKLAVLSVQAGDSGVIKFYQEGGIWKCKALCDFMSPPISQYELSGDLNEVDVKLAQVNKGEILVGATDGIWETISKYVYLISYLGYFHFYWHNLKLTLTYHHFFPEQ